MPGAAKRLIFSLVVLAGLGGCVAYVPPPSDSYAYYDGGGELVYATPRVVAPVYVEPRYAAPPVSLSFGFSSWSGRHYHGHRGYGHSYRHRGGGWHGHRRR